MAGASIPASRPTTGTLDEIAFHAAVADALKDYHIVQALNANPLLGSALVLTGAGGSADEDGRVRVLREQIGQAVDTLAQEPEPAPQHARILRRTYIKAAVNQKLAAHAMGIGYSTYRRRLAEARKALATALWHVEVARR